MSELDKLIEAVEAGAWDGSWQRLQDIVADIDALAFSRAYHGSLDAALSLHKALLPGWPILWDSDCDGHKFTVSEYNCYDSSCTSDATNQIPARAWLLAILRAYRSTQE